MGIDGETPILRRLRRGDAGAVLAAFRSNDDMARQGGVTSLADAEAYVDRLLRPSQEPWVIDVVGRCKGLVCVSVDEANLSGWFWYWMHDDYRGRGWMRRAAATVADWALTARGLQRLELGHRVDNPASGAIARAAGFVLEGTEREKFLIAGRRVDVDTYGRLVGDPAVEFEPLVMRG